MEFSLSDELQSEQKMDTGVLHTKVAFEGMANVSLVYRDMFTVVVSDFHQAEGIVIRSRRQPY